MYPLLKSCSLFFMHSQEILVDAALPAPLLATHSCVEAEKA
jgi:hypothetical protein